MVMNEFCQLSHVFQSCIDDFVLNVFIFLTVVCKAIYMSVFMSEVVRRKSF